jgi:hypothetical protein
MGLVEARSIGALCLILHIETLFRDIVKNPVDEVKNQLSFKAKIGWPDRCRGSG